MGQNFSLTTLSAGSAGLDVPELSDLVYEKSMGSARFMKSIRARHQDGVVLVKVFVKPYAMSLRKYKGMILREARALADIPNTVGYERIIETETNGYLVRQYLYSSLYDRISTRPFLEHIEKKWLAFQLLCAIRDCHGREIFHGDIKTENILVTSWNWLYLSDFSSSFKPKTLPDDNPADFSYYFDTAGRRTCYLAPERFLRTDENADPDAKVTWAMDVFSVGCVIAELFLETPIFNLSQMYMYKKGAYDPVAIHVNHIADKDIRELVTHMIQVEPELRYSADEYLNFWRQKVFPEYFYNFLHQYMALITDPSSGRAPISGALANLGEADERIARVYYDFDKIAYFLGYEYENIPNTRPSSLSSGLPILPVCLNIPNNEHQVTATGRRPADDGTLIFLTVVVSALRHTARTSARLQACDIILAFSERLTDEAKLDRVLPYLVTLLSDEADLVKIAALRSLTQLLAIVNVISPVNANIFPEYILKRTRECLLCSERSPSPIVRATYAACLGSLASTASRYLDMVTTLRADGSLSTADPDMDDGENMSAIHHGLYDSARAELVEIFEYHTKALIQDTDSSVRRALIGSVPELCIFFGSAESNDIILSHLNTYLNDRDWMLKCAFFENMVSVATFLGSTTLEEFILPLMVQALTDPEEFVVERVLRSLSSMGELGLFQRPKTWELVDIVARFSIHPNIWIREAAASFLSSSTKYLSIADNRCIVLPLIRPYLKIDVLGFSEVELLDALKKPLSRSVLDLACTWAVKADRGLFWKPAQRSRPFSFGARVQNLAHLLYKDVSHNAFRGVSRNDEDELWIEKLRSIGLTIEDEFKLLMLREYIWRIAPSKSRDVAMHHPPYLNNVINLRDFKITPQTVMFDDQHPLDDPLREIKSEIQGEKGHTISDALLDASMTIDESLGRRKRSAYNVYQSRLNSRTALPDHDRQVSIISSTPRSGSLDATSTAVANEAVQKLPSGVALDERNGKDSEDDASFSTETSSPTERRGTAGQIRHKSSAMVLLSRKETSKSIPETSTTSTNAFGRIEGPFIQTANQPAAVVLSQDRKEAARADVKFHAAHTYTGHDPSILHMLDTMYAENYPTDMLEFGPLVMPVSRRKAITRSSMQAVDRPWRPAGILVATFAEHAGPVSRIAVAPDHVFFITGGDDGCVKIWDTARLERNITHRSRQTHKHADNVKVTSLCFVENTHCFISTGSDGSIHVVRVEYVFAGGVSTGRYGKLRLLREHLLPAGEYAVWSDQFKIDNLSVLLVATNRSRVLALNLRDMRILYALENPVHHGSPTCFVVDRKRHWILLGTSHGVLDLWDLRFKVRLKGWGVPGATAIHRLCLHPFKGRGRWVCVAGGSGQGDVTVWDVEKTQCREIYRACGSREGLKAYEPWSVDEDRPEGMLGRFATAIDPSVEGSTDRGIRAMVAGTDTHEDGRDNKYGFLLTGGSDKKIRFWDLAHVESSIVVSGLDAEEVKPTFTTSHPTTSLTLNAERQARSGPTSQNAAPNSKGSSGTKTTNARPPRSTVISLQQQNLLKSHLDSILDVALLESPYGMTVSVDRSGCTYVFQ